MPTPMPAWQRLLIWYLAVAALAVAPVLLALGAGALASALGCRLDESQPHPCPLGPLNLGGALYSLSGLGWLALVSIPLGAIAIVIRTLLLFVPSRTSR